MGVFTYEREITTTIAPGGLFKAFIHDAHNVLPKAAPQAFQKIDTTFRNGRRPDTVYKVHFATSKQFKYMLHQTDATDTQNLTYSYTVQEGDVLSDVLEKISYDNKYEANTDGGSIVKNRITYYTNGGIEINEDQLRLGKDKVDELFKAIKAYLVANHDAYN